MKKPNLSRSLAHPVASRAAAAVLAGLLLMSSVPAAALAEAADTAQQVVATQQQPQDQGTAVATDAKGTADASATPDAAAATGQTAASGAVAANGANASTDANATAGAATTDAATTDAAAIDANTTTDAATTDATATTDVAAATTSAIADAKASTPTSDAIAASGQGTDAPKKSVKSDENTKKRTWDDYNGGGSSDGLVTAVKGIVTTIGDAVGQQYGSAAVSLLGVLTQDDAAQYTCNDIMHKLYDVENQISGVSSQVYNLQNSLENFQAESFYRDDMRQIDGFKELLCKDGDGVRQGLITLNNALNEYKELDENGNPTDTACSLETPVERMPQEARDAAMSLINQFNSMAAQYTNKDSVAGTEFVLAGAITDHDNNFINDYFNLLNKRFNWDVESFSAKQDFLVMLAQMYVNAYSIENAELRLQIANAKTAGEDTAALENRLASLAERAARVKVALFGEDGNSGFAADASAKGNTATCYVTGQTFDLGTYACVSAYSPSCFEGAYAEGTKGRADKCASSWSANSTFTTDQVVQMVSRLNAMKKAGCAPKKSDGSEADGILEEMEAIGFKNVKTDGNEQSTTWNERLPSHKGYPRGGGGTVSNRFVELGDPNQQSLLPDKNEFHLGNRLTNSGDYVLTNVTKPRADAGSKTVIFSPTGEGAYRAYCAYGDVVNVKTGEVIKDQLLYVLHNETVSTSSFLSTLEYYAFGTLRLGTTDPSIDAIKN